MRLSRRWKRRIGKVVNVCGCILAGCGVFLLTFVACCLDSEGEEAWRFLCAVLAIGAVLTAAGAVMVKATQRARKAYRPMFYGHEYRQKKRA